MVSFFSFKRMLVPKHVIPKLQRPGSAIFYRASVFVESDDNLQLSLDYSKMWGLFLTSTNHQSANEFCALCDLGL